MALRFFKSIKLAPGIRLNLSKRGVSTTIGSKGLRYTVGTKSAKKGTMQTRRMTPAERVAAQAAARAKTPFYKKRWVQITGGVLVVAGIIGSFSDDKAEAPAPALAGSTTAPIVSALPASISTPTPTLAPTPTPEPTQAPTLTPATPQPAQAEKLYVKGEDVNMRSGPGTDHEVVQKISAPAAVVVIEKAGDWYHVTTEDGTEGYLRQDFVSSKSADETVPDKTENPAPSNERIVYRGETGDKYHLKSCRTLKNGAYEITLNEALNQGRGPCGICNP